MEWLPCNTKNRLFTRSWTARVRFLYPWAGWKTHGGLWKSGWIWCMYVYICMYIYKHTYTREYMHTYIHMGICSWPCIYTHTYPCVGHHHSVSSWRNSNAGYYGKVDGYGVWHHVLWLWHCWYLCVYLIDILCGSGVWHHVLWLGHCWYLCVYFIYIQFVFYVDMLFDTMCYGSGIAGICVYMCIFVSTLYCVHVQIYKFIHGFVYFCIFGVSHHVSWLGYCWYLCIYICIFVSTVYCVHIQIYRLIHK